MTEERSFTDQCAPVRRDRRASAESTRDELLVKPPQACARCPDCGLVQIVPEPKCPSRACCVRCGRILRSFEPSSLKASTACAISALALLIAGFSLPLISVRSLGRYSEATLATGPATLAEKGSWELSLVLVITLFLAPALQLIVLLVAALGSPIRAFWGRRWAPFESLRLLGRWSMLEIFLVGVAVAWTRLSYWLAVSAAPALLALMGAVLSARVASASALPKRLLYEAPPPTRAAGVDSGSARRKQDSLNRCAALTVSGFLLYVPANLLPIMTIRRLAEGGPKTILGGIRELVHDGSWVLALIVFLASIAIPLLKLCALSVLLVLTLRRSSRALRGRARVFRLLQAVGRWSMLDIFVLSLLVGLVRFGVLGYVVPEPGALAFCGVVVVTMLATELFDPKAMWPS